MSAFVDVGIWNADTLSHASVNLGAINLVAGNAVIVFVRYEASATPITITDTAGNVYTEITPTHVPIGATSARISAFYCLNCLGNAANVVTLTFSTAKEYIRASAHQWSGLGSFVNHETVSTSGTAIAGSGLAASTSGLLFAGIGSFSGITASLANDLTNSRGLLTETAGEFAADGDAIVAGAGTVTGGFTLTSNSAGLISALFADEATPTGSISDAKLNKLETALAKSGHVSDLEVEWLQSLHVSVTSNCTMDAWHEYWDSQVIAAGHFNDRAYAWLGSLGHTGSLSDRWLSYWSS